MANSRIVSLLWVVVTAAACPSPCVHAQSPAPARDAGPCVLLKNDNVLFGHARQVGQWVVVRTGLGGEVQVPRGEVACWAGSPRDLYRYRVDHRQKGDLAAHLRDAEWCLRYDLYDLATDEIREIRKLDPANPSADLIELRLRRLTEPPAPSTAVTGRRPDQLRRVDFVRPADEPSDETRRMDPAVLGAFARHVQPMLLNRCGRCHNPTELGGRQGWALILPTPGARASSRMTRENLAALMPYIDPLASDNSAILVKATSAHGGSPPPLDARGAKAAETLESWLAMAAQTLAQGQSADAPIESVPFPELTGQNDPVVAERPVVPAEPSRPGQPARLPRVANPFDPDLFNRRFHPGDARPN